MLKKNISKSDLETLEEIEQKYVQKKYDSKFAKKMKSEMPELVMAEGLTPQNLFMYQSGISEGNSNMEGTINLENLATDAQKVELKFGRVEFTDKKGKKVKGLDPNIFRERENDDDSDGYVKSIKTTKTRRKFKKRKKSKRKSSLSPPTAPSLTNSSNKGKRDKKGKLITIKTKKSKRLNPYDPYAQFQFSPENFLESFPSLGDMVFDIIPKTIFVETLNFNHNWTVRFISTEQACLSVRGYTKPLDNGQKWGLTKYIYVLFCGGQKIEFLGSRKMKKIQE